MITSAFTLPLLALGVTAYASDLPAGHPWVAPGTGDVRSPCPGLNVLANHGYLAHSGRNLTKTDLTSAIKLVYNFDDQTADFFAEAGLQVNGPRQETLNLDELDKHDSIEHDASLTRLDAVQGDNHSVQPALVQAVIADASPATTLSVKSLAKSRNRRDKESLAAGGQQLPPKLRLFSYGEAALILSALGELTPTTDGEPLPPVEAFESWVGREQLPDNYHVPRRMITGASLAGLMTRVLATAATANSPFSGILNRFRRSADASVPKEGLFVHAGRAMPAQ